MIENGFSKNFSIAAVLVLSAFLLSGCLEDDEAKSTEETAFDNVLSGSVGDGPVIGATMRVLTNGGVEIVQFESDSMAVYNVNTKAKGKHYPLTIDSQGGIDLVTNLAPDFTLLGAVLEPGEATVANVNPFSTFALAIARGLPGGVTKETIESGQTIAVTVLNSGLSSLRASGPLNTRIDNSNIAEIVKASETLAEVVRRTRDWLNAYGHAASGDEVILRLASDLSDSWIDGVGGYRSDSRTAAIAKVVVAQVLLESASNELHVNGIDATNAMKSAIEQVTSTSPQVTIDDQTVTSEMLTSVRVGLTAALAVSEAPKLLELAQAVEGLQGGMDYMLVRTLLPDDYRATLESVITLVAAGDASVIATVNDINVPGEISVPGGDDPPVNRAPLIQGVPSTSVQVGSSYFFEASASDPDGDSLTFSIAGLPVWAIFDETTGELSGTPGDEHVGVYTDIRISVSDGSVDANLAPFSITVNAIALGTVTLNWIAPTENEDGSLLTDLDQYRIYWGTNSGIYPNSVTIDAGTTTYVVENLATGTYEFVATSINAAGVESAYSNPATKTVL